MARVLAEIFARKESGRRTPGNYLDSNTPYPFQISSSLTFSRSRPRIGKHNAHSISVSGDFSRVAGTPVYFSARHFLARPAAHAVFTRGVTCDQNCFVTDHAVF